MIAATISINGNADAASPVTATISAIRMSYVKMLWMALPCSIVLSVVGIIAIAAEFQFSNKPGSARIIRSAVLRSIRATAAR
ncbi:MAG: hypothetical protein JSU67_05310 [Gammaproteobacteria bacterium]|nr:MAG: hypothetical protein JSU67_05310 [Gammaproteobacteria bacterium]